METIHLVLDTTLLKATGHTARRRKVNSSVSVHSQIIVTLRLNSMPHNGSRYFRTSPNIRSWPDLHVDGNLLTIASFENQVVRAQETRTRLPVEDPAPEARSDWQWDA